MFLTLTSFHSSDVNRYRLPKGVGRYLVTSGAMDSEIKHSDWLKLGTWLATANQSALFQRWLVTQFQK